MDRQQYRCSHFGEWVRIPTVDQQAGPTQTNPPSESIRLTRTGRSGLLPAPIPVWLAGLLFLISALWVPAGLIAAVVLGLSPNRPNRFIGGACGATTLLVVAVALSAC